MNSFNRITVKVALAAILITLGVLVSWPTPAGSFDSVVLIRYVPSDKADADRLRAECSMGCTLGSGVAIPGGYIVTAAHVMSGGGWKVGDAIPIVDFEGNEHQATLLKVDALHDVALLRYEWTSGPTSPLVCSADYKPGDPVVIRGGPLFLGLLTGSGHILRMPTPPGPWVMFGEYIVFDGAVSHGSSGGPVYDERGRVIGLVDRLVLDDSHSDGGGLRLAVPAQYACDLLG